MNRLVVDELIQTELNLSNLLSSLNKILKIETRQDILNNYNQLYNILKQEQTTENLADIILTFPHKLL